MLFLGIFSDFIMISVGLVIAGVIGIKLAFSLRNTFRFVRWSQSHLKDIMPIEGDSHLHTGIATYVNRLLQLIFRNTLRISNGDNPVIGDIINRLEKGAKKKIYYAFAFFGGFLLWMILQINFEIPPDVLVFGLITSYIGFFCVTLIQMYLIRKWVDQVCIWLTIFTNLQSLRENLHDLYDQFAPNQPEDSNSWKVSLPKMCIHILLPAEINLKYGARSWRRA